MNNPLISYSGNYSEPGYGEATDIVHELIKLVGDLEGSRLIQRTRKTPTYMTWLPIHSPKNAWMTYIDLQKIIDGFAWDAPQVLKILYPKIHDVWKIDSLKPELFMVWLSFHPSRRKDNGIHV